MFTLFTTEDILCKIARNKLDNIWLKILKCQDQVFISRNPNYEYEQDVNDVIETLETSYDLFITEDSEYINSIMEHPNNVLQKPMGAFILEISPEEAKEIQSKYGVICQSIDALDESVFTKEMSSISVIEGCSDVSWNDLLSELNTYPMNSLMIIDRYMFGYEHKHKSGTEDAIENIRVVLNEILPKELDCNFQILIIFDGEQKYSRNYDFDKVLTALNKIKKSLRRPYNIDIELVSATRNTSQYAITHNRRIISNYFKIEMLHLAKVFRNGDGAGICSQDVTLKFLFSGASHKKGNLNGLPYKGINNDIEDFRNALETAKRNVDNYEYGYNGSSKYTVSACKNRLISIQ